MSAIFGILNQKNFGIDQDDLSRMNTSLLHRGPDGASYSVKDHIGFGHGMFRTTPEAINEILPFEDAETEILITSDARIDNREELALALKIDESQLTTLPDSYFILEAYKKWQEKCAEHLLGDFAFAIWDEKAQTLFCARDHMGIKPFNYYIDAETFVFASEAEAVNQVSNVNHQLNEARVADSFFYELEGYDWKSTFFEEIYRLPAGNFLLLQDGKLKIERYWAPDLDKKIRFDTDEEYVEAFTQLYTDAIQKRLRSNNDIASMLSGGMDSSSIVGIAKRLYKEKRNADFPVFSAISINNKSCKDTYYIQAMIADGDLESYSISTDDLEIINTDINSVLKSTREPYDPMLMIIALYLKAQKEGFRIMLDGIDGDLICSNSPIYPAFLLKNFQFEKAFREMKLISKNYYGGRLSTIHILYQNLRFTYVPEAIKKIKSAFRRPVMKCKMHFHIINPLFATKVTLSDRLLATHHKKDIQACFISKQPSIHSIQALSVFSPHFSAAIERYDRTSALCKIEARHPLLDKRLIEFMLTVPADQKARLGWNKFLLRSSSEKFLPKEVTWRKGWEHIGWDFEYLWLCNNLPLVCKTIQYCQIRYKTYFNNKRIQTTIEQSIEQNKFKKNSLGIKNAETLLSLYHLSNWLKTQEPS